MIETAPGSRKPSCGRWQARAAQRAGGRVRGKSTVRKSDHGLMSAQRYTGRQRWMLLIQNSRPRAARAWCARRVPRRGTPCLGGEPIKSGHDDCTARGWISCCVRPRGSPVRPVKSEDLVPTTKLRTRPRLGPQSRGSHARRAGRGDRRPGGGAPARHVVQADDCGRWAARRAGGEAREATQSPAQVLLAGERRWRSG